MASQMLGVSLRARCGSTQVMLGGNCGPDGDTGQMGHISSITNSDNG